MNLEGKKVTLHDMCLRDGMHAVRHQISVEQMVALATALGGQAVRYEDWAGEFESVDIVISSTAAVNRDSVARVAGPRNAPRLCPK